MIEKIVKHLQVKYWSIFYITKQLPAITCVSVSDSCGKENVLLKLQIK